MGNYISCTLMTTPSMKSSRAARVIFPSGEIRQFREPIKAAEMMLESPNFFLVNSRSLQIGRRFSPLCADEDLEFGNVYIMFQMKRLNSIVTAGDMAVLFMAANSAAKRISGGKVRILPDTSVDAQAAAAAEDVTTETAAVVDSSRLMNSEGVEGFPALEFKYRLAACRSKKPMLETIKEEPISSR